MSTTFDQDPDPTGSIAACYAIFGEDDARMIAAKVPRATEKGSLSKRKDDDDDSPSDIYIA